MKRPYLVSIGIQISNIHFHRYFSAKRKWKQRNHGHLVITSYKRLENK